MKRISSLAIATISALSILVASASAPAHAGNRGHHIAAGVILGVIGGAIIASEINRRNSASDYGYNGDVYDDTGYVEPRRSRHVRHSSASRWERHVRRCYRQYRSYDERSDTFIGYDGRVRKCRL